MLTSTPKKAVSSEASLIQCLICAESLENNQGIAVFGRSQWDLRERHFPRIEFRSRVAFDTQRIEHV